MTREEAIKRFETLLLHVDTDCVMGMETTEAINMAIEALQAKANLDDVSTAYENGYKQGKFEALQWIPCSERLPEKDGKYLITEVDGYVTCDYFRLENGDWRTTFWRYPKAWMPLPEPYKENES